MLFSKNKGERWMIVGLGNPESRYDETRHNAGFIAIDEIAKGAGATFNKKKHRSLMSDTQIDGVRVLLVKPQTYMNNSGEAVEEISQFYKIPPERIIVLFDDISLDVGKIRLRRKGSAGGQKGMKSIIECTGSENFPRVKIGIGAPPRRDYDLADWVLSRFTADEKDALDSAVKNTEAAVKLILKGQMDRAMNKYTS